MILLIYENHLEGIGSVKLNNGHDSICIRANSHEDRLMVELSWPGPELCM